MFSGWCACSLRFRLFLVPPQGGGNTINGTSEIFHIAFKKRESWLCPFPDFQPCPPVPASQGPKQHLPSVEMPIPTGNFPSIPIIRGRPSWWLSLLIHPKMSSPFLPCLNYLHVTSQRKDKVVGSYFLCPKPFHIKARRWFNLKGKSVRWVSWKPLVLLLKIPSKRVTYILLF